MRPAGGENVPPVPVLRPQLPPADRLLPYLRRIDANRIYSNWGPLVTELESRLVEHLRVPAGGVTTAGSGTSALIGAILASAQRAAEDRRLAVVPAYTFVATALAVERCGYRPYLADIEPTSWMLDPERLADHPLLDQVGLVVPVAPFGRPVPQSPWRAFREQTGIPVVIDGGASFDRVTESPRSFLGDVPVVMSFHATKCFATGEGGCVSSTDVDLVLRAAEAMNFGFHMVRECRSASINGKMSEYHAAVGLAELDGWGEKHRALRGVASRYRRQLVAVGLADRLVATPDVSASYVLFRCDDASESDHLRESLTRSGVDHRQWYGKGLHHEPHFSTLPREELEITERLAPCLVGVPLAPDLADAAVTKITQVLARALRSSAATAP